MEIASRNFARNPASMITADNIRTALLNRIVHPLALSSRKVLAFRMAWSTKNFPEDIIWQQLASHSRQAFEQDMMACEGVSFFITSATATVSNQTKRRDVCPALGCFVVSEDVYFKEAPLYIRLRNNPYGGTLKLMNDRGVKPGEDRNLVWLSLLLKDNVESGYVLGKMVQAGAARGNSVVKVFVHAENFRQPLLEAKRALEAEGFPLDIEFF